MDIIRKNEQEILRLVEAPVSNEEPLPLLKYPMLMETGIVEHAFTTRAGGVSEGMFSTLNLSFTRGDQREKVETNFRRLAKALGVSADDFVFSDQTHTVNVLRVGTAERGMGITRERNYHDIDGLITNEPGVVLSTFYADCVPLFFVDTRHRAIGLSHSGWRGTVRRMGKATLLAMAEEFGTRPEDVLAAIGPSICRECYEISADVAAEFEQEFQGRETEILIDKGNGKYLLDLWKCNEIVLEEAGILPKHLAVTNICTCCNHSLLFSHRASHGMRGNLGAFLYLRG